MQIFGVSRRRSVSETSDPISSGLVGRANQCREILGVLEHALGGGGQELVQLIGPRGSGRTRLLRETIRMARTFGFDVSEGIGDEGPTHSTAPLLIAVDDPDSLRSEQLDAILAVTRCRPRRFVLATTATCSRPIAAFPRTTKVLLDPLDAEASEAMVTDLVGATLGADLRRLVMAAGGNPWLLATLVAGLCAERRITLLRGEATVRGNIVPELVTTAVSDRLAELSAPCRRLINAVAVAASPVSPAAISAVIDCDATAALAVADEANAAGVLGYLDGVIRFHNPLIQRVVLAAIPRAVRTATARLVADSGIAVSALPDTGTIAAIPLLDAESPGCAAADRQADQDRPIPWHRLSDTERIIVALVSQGMTNRQIANRVYLSPHTVNYHLRGIFRKLQVSSRVELAAVVRERPAPEAGASAR